MYSWQVLRAACPLLVLNPAACPGRCCLQFLCRFVPAFQTTLRGSAFCRQVAPRPELPVVCAINALSLTRRVRAAQRLSRGSGGLRALRAKPKIRLRHFCSLRADEPRSSIWSASSTMPNTTGSYDHVYRAREKISLETVSLKPSESHSRPSSETDCRAKRAARRAHARTDSRCCNKRHYCNELGGAHSINPPGFRFPTLPTAASTAASNLRCPNCGGNMEQARIRYRSKRRHPLDKSRRRAVSALAKAPVDRPAWDATTQDLGRHRLSEKELLQRKLAAISPNNPLAGAELRRRLGPEADRLFGACGL
jgi:hypothetical protein